MKRTYKYALTAVLGAVIITPALAQDNFPDVPDNHWAYEALARMKRDGLLVGYPDGLFRGGRPASRYEMAVAIHATYVHLKNITDSLQSQIDALKGASDADLRNAIAALQNDVNALKGMRGDLDNLRRMVDTFQKELQALGVDVEAMKRDLGDLNARVEALEKRKPAVDISGDVNFLLLGGHSIDNNRNGALNKDGRTAGIVGDGAPVGLNRDFSILHEAAVTLAGTNETGPKWRGTFVIGNMMRTNHDSDTDAVMGFGNQSSFTGGIGTNTGRGFRGYGEPDSDWYVQDLGIRFDTSLAGLAFNAEAGRIGYKINPLYYQRPDNTTYYANERWDDGMWRFDGAILGFNFGGAKLDVFGGKNSLRNSVNGQDLNPMVLGATNAGGSVNNWIPSTNNPDVDGLPPATMRADRSLGASLNIPLSTAGNVNVSYIFLDSDFNTASNFNRVTVLGGSANYNIGAVRLEGGYAQTDLRENDESRLTDDNVAFYGKISYAQPSWNVFAGYKEVGRFYSAPGDWGRLGIVRNPVNIRGFQVGGAIDFSRGLSLSASGEFYNGKDDTYAAGAGGFQGTGLGADTPWGEDSDITKWEVRLGYNVNSNLSLGLGYEENSWKDLVGGGDPKFRWTTFDLGYGLSETARLLLKYELSDHDLASVNAGEFRGGFLTTQLSLKF